MTNSKKDSTIHCKKCNKTFINKPVTVACAVMHLDGQCCHYGMKEVVDSKKDSELELILTNLRLGGKPKDAWTTENDTAKIAEALQAIKRITKEESDRRVLEARIEELGNVQLEHGRYTSVTYVNGSAMTIKDRIAELRELLKGDKDGKD